MTMYSVAQDWKLKSFSFLILPIAHVELYLRSDRSGSCQGGSWVYTCTACTDWLYSCCVTSWAPVYTFCTVQRTPIRSLEICYTGRQAGRRHTHPPTHTGTHADGLYSEVALAKNSYECWCEFSYVSHEYLYADSYEHYHEYQLEVTMSLCLHAFL